MSLNIIARKDYEDLQKNIKKVACYLFFVMKSYNLFPSGKGFLKFELT
jgi:hypothetical protein